MTKHLTTREAVDYLSDRGLQFTVGTFNVWRSIGRGPQFKRVGGRVFYTLNDLNTFADGETISPSVTQQAGE